eukprot:SAG22_NODE_151_length_17414_cov_7.812128_11_plen_581_part_00
MSAAAAASSASAVHPGGPAPPDAFLCPISRELMADPVCAADGHSYEKTEIKKWFATGKQTSPMTNDAMPDRTLRPNRQLKSHIEEWRGKSNKEWVTTIIGEVAMADDQKAVEAKLGSLARFVGQNKAVVQPSALQKLSKMLQDASSPVQQGLRAVEAECKLVAAGFAARLRDERRDQGLAAAAAAAAKAKLAELDIEIAAAEEQLAKKKKARERKAKDVARLERVERDCVAGVTQAEKELGGYPEPLGLLDEGWGREQPAAAAAASSAEDDTAEASLSANGLFALMSAFEAGADAAATAAPPASPADAAGAAAAAAAGGRQTRSKRKRAGAEGEERHGTAVAKRQRGGGSGKAAGDYQALLREGLEWLHGDKFRVTDKVRGKLLIEAAAAGGLPLAVASCQHMGWGGFSGDDDDEKAVFEKFREVTAAGGRGASWMVAEAERMLGWCCQNGIGVEKDEVEGVKWYRKAAEQGHSLAQNNLGVCYRKGRGVEQDKAEAVKWYRKAAEQGHSTAQTDLGTCYFNGTGVEKDYAEAVKWLRKAAEQGESSAMRNLATCYRAGRGVDRDEAEAGRWDERAAAAR